MIDSQLSLETIFCQPFWTHHYSWRQTDRCDNTHLQRKMRRQLNVEKHKTDVQSPALLMRMSSLSSLSRKSLANCLTEYMDARSRCRITTLPFPVHRRISSAACSARVRSLHAITTRAPGQQHKHTLSPHHDHVNT